MAHPISERLKRKHNPRPAGAVAAGASSSSSSWQQQQHNKRLTWGFLKTQCNMQCDVLYIASGM
jgi:hypothetical protein